MTETSTTTSNEFERGDLALHKNNQLDARPVECVEGDKIRLRIGTLVTDPVSAKNYHRTPGRCPGTGRSASACEFVDHRTCPDLRPEAVSS